jgi:type II secretory pathway pseudopilin PulG
MSQYPSPIYDQGTVTPSRGMSTTKILLIVFGVLGAFGLLCIGVLAALLLPAIGAARDAARKASCTNNIRQIAIALAQYESTYKCYPPAYTLDASGNRLHSWRALILPFLDEPALYESIDFSKPWNDPVNSHLLTSDVPIFRCPHMPQAGTSNYVVLEGPDCALKGGDTTTIAEIVDGLANTVMLVEVSNDAAVAWAEPKDMSVETFLNQPLRSNHSGGAHVATCDVSVKLASEQMDSRVKQAISTRSGNESIASP